MYDGIIRLFCFFFAILVQGGGTSQAPHLQKITVSQNILVQIGLSFSEIISFLTRFPTIYFSLGTYVYMEGSNPMFWLPSKICLLLLHVQYSAGTVRAKERKHEVDHVPFTLKRVH